VSFATLSNSKNKPTQFIIKREESKEENHKKKKGEEKRKEKPFASPPQLTTPSLTLNNSSHQQNNLATMKDLKPRVPNQNPFGLTTNITSSTEDNQLFQQHPTPFG
jgi:hypothetical protein